MSYILAIDQGTTSSRAIVFDDAYKIIASHSKEFEQFFPASGYVEHDLDEIWESVVFTCRKAIEKANITPQQIAAIGITNQRETVAMWDKTTGNPIHKAIVWQDRRSSKYCAELKEKAFEKFVTEKTGLLLDPYFSATKIRWILENVEGARTGAENGEIIFGTIDSYLLWKLTKGKAHKTDATNASRTLLYNIHENQWDDELLELFDVPRKILPQVEDCAAEFGISDPNILGASIPILGMAGDQHAASIGQACFQAGMVKSTYGTGCFMMLNTGPTPVKSKNKLLTTLCYRLNGKTSYALEGSIFIAGAAVQWLRDGLKLIEKASASGPLARKADSAQELILVPAFAGLGAPYWKPDVRGAIYGLTRNSGAAEFSRAALESVCFQTRDLVEAMNADWQNDQQNITLRVDGGMVASDWTMQFLADVLNAPIDRPTILETTALGAAWLAGMKAGVWPDQEGFANAWALERQFTPKMDETTRARRYQAWKSAIESTIRMQNPI